MTQPRPRLHLLISARLSVAFETGSTDTLTGGAGINWFWSQDGLDLLDRTAAEPLNITP